MQRYRYMIQTAPPETIEQAHEEAFSKLTPDQRRKVLAGLASSAPPAERSAIEATSSDDPKALARIATRAEVRQPGSMERVLGSPGLGIGASLLTSFAMGFVGSMVAQSFLSAMGGFGDGGDGQAAADNAADPADGGQEEGDVGGMDDAGADDFGDFEV